MLLTFSWEQRRLGEVIEGLYNGQTPSRFNKDNWNGSINWLSSGELNRSIVVKTVEKISSKGKSVANLKVIPKGTVVIAITGLEAAGTRGNCAKLGIDTTLNQSCMAIFPKREILDSDYLFHWYKKIGESYGIRYTQGTKQQSYNAEIIKILPITLPKIEEQQVIARFLDDVDHQITVQQRKSVSKDEVMNLFLCKSNTLVDVDVYANSWEQRRLGEIGSVEMNKRILKKDTLSFGEIPFYKIGTFGGEADAYISRELFETYKSKYPYPKVGDLLISASGSIGKIVEYTGKDEYFQDSNIVWLNHNDKVKNIFLKFFYEVVRWDGIEGSTIKRLYNKNILNTKIWFPTSDEQQKIGQFFEQLDHHITFQQRM